MTLANNRVSSSVNFTQLAEKLEGYTGSDIKEVCREAVVRVAHERAKQLENGRETAATAGKKILCDQVFCVFVVTCLPTNFIQLLRFMQVPQW